MASYKIPLPPKELGLSISKILFVTLSKKYRSWVTNNNALLNYPFTNNINSFNEVGVNEDRIINGDVLIRILKNN